MVDLFPPLALFGASTQGTIPEGQMFVEPLELLCSENAPYLPEHVAAWAREHGGALADAWDHVETVNGVALDATTDPNKRRLLSAGARAGVDDRLLKRENATAMDDDVAKQDSKSTLMPYTWQEIVKGSLFYWQLRCDCYSALEVDTFMVALGCALADLRVGGRRRAGNGRLTFVAGWNVQLQRSEAAEPFAPNALSAASVGDLFRSHVRERKDKIADFLKTVSA
jgi:hypothetical protein